MKKDTTGTPTKRIRRCFICLTDITNKPKILSFYAYRQNSKKELSKRDALCRECAQKDLEIAHFQATYKYKNPVSIVEKLLAKFNYYQKL